MQDSAGKEASQGAKPTDFDLDCPAEFRAISLTFTAKQIHDAYPLLHLYDKPSAREYLDMSVFMQRYHGYKFAWVLESDMRYTGADWGVFLNSMLNLALTALGTSNSIPEQYTESLSSLPTPDAKLPDLVVMRHGAINDQLILGADITETYKPRDAEHWRFKRMLPGGTTFFGISRLYADILHVYSVDGVGGYIEEFLITLAVEEELDIVSMPFPEFGGAMIHCCIYHGRQYYNHWYLSKECRHPALVHPVKNSNESIWGRGQDRF